MTRALVICLLVTVSSGCAVPSGGPSPAGPDGDAQSFVEQALQTSGAPALGVVVVRDGRVLERVVAGVRVVDSEEPVTVEDQWHIGSLTKAMTATVIARYVERGILAWDLKPSDVWPELVQDPGYRDVTMLDLLTHRAGIIEDVVSVPDLRSVLTPHLPVEEQRLLWTQALMQQAPERPLGEYHYSNGGYLVAGAMLETLVGARWETLMQIELFDPLGMTRTGFGPPLSGQPAGHRDRNGRLVASRRDNPAALGPAATVHTTLDDYARFMLLHLGDPAYAGILLPRTLGFLHRARSPSGMAVGWLSQREPGLGRVLRHNGTNTWWWAQVLLLPDHDAGILIAANAPTAQTQRAITRLERQITQQVLGIR